MSCLSIADLLDASAADLFDMEREAVWGDATLVFEDEDKVELAEVETGWRGAVIVDAASGNPELEIEVLPQSAVTEAMLADDVRYLVLKGRRHEKRSDAYQYRTDAPERHQMRFQPIGEVV